MEGREATRFIRENSGKKNPFFLYVPINSPHGASNGKKNGIRPPKQYVEQYSDADGSPKGVQWKVANARKLRTTVAAPIDGSRRH